MGQIVGKSIEFTSLQIVGLIAMAVLSSRAPVLQPILLGGLQDEHRISVDQIGHAATAEAIGMMLATIIAGAFLQSVHLRLIAAIAAMTMMIANGVTLYSDAGVIVIARFINGAASGVMIWIFIGLIARLHQPGRLFAIYVTVQSILSFLLSSLIMSVILPKWGVAGGYGTLLALNVILLAFSLIIPQQYPALERAGGLKYPTGRGLLGLCAAMLFMAGIFSVWVYVVPLARQLGHSSSHINVALNLAIAVQILGGLVATRYGDTWHGGTTTVMAAILSAFGIFMLLAFAQLWIFYAAISLIAFLWMLTPAFCLPMIFEFDPSGRSALFIATAQLGGIAFGPMAASVMIDANDFRGAALVSICAFIGCALLPVLERATRNRVTCCLKNNKVS